MTRKTTFALIAAVAGLVALPLALVALGGDGGGGGRDRSIATDARSPERIPGYNAPLEGGENHVAAPQRRDERPRGGGAGKRKARSEPHAESFDEAMDGVAYPAAITRAGRPAVLAVEDALGGEVTAGQQTVIAADCRGGVCSVRYRTSPRGSGVVLSTQQPILRALFARRDVRAVVLYVHHKTVGQRKEERPAFITVTCRRAEHPNLRWSRITTRQIARRCHVVQHAGGKLRNHVRRGIASVDEASRGVGGDGGARQTRGAAAPKGAKPPGTPAPRHVKPRTSDPNGETARGG